MNEYAIMVSVIAFLISASLIAGILKLLSYKEEIEDLKRDNKLVRKLYAQENLLKFRVVQGEYYKYLEQQFIVNKFEDSPTTEWKQIFRQGEYSRFHTFEEGVEYHIKKASGEDVSDIIYLDPKQAKPLVNENGDGISYFDSIISTTGGGEK